MEKVKSNDFLKGKQIMSFKVGLELNFYDEFIDYYYKNIAGKNDNKSIFQILYELEKRIIEMKDGIEDEIYISYCPNSYFVFHFIETNNNATSKGDYVALVYEFFECVTYH